jgi:O-6-methylguanine DNA methyltransferase
MATVEPRAEPAALRPGAPDGAAPIERVLTATVETRIGALRLAATEQGLACLSLPRAGGRGLTGWLARHAPRARREESSAAHRDAARQLVEYLDGGRTRFELALDLRGTPFQRAVWERLLAIPYGETRSYAEIARALGSPGAVRAVGAANGANPVALVVPCHRVIQSGGKLGGYGGGLDLKRRLLAMEQSVRHQGSLL